jgi:hypothetical protein
MLRVGLVSRQTVSDTREPGCGLVRRRWVLIEPGWRWCAVIVLAADPPAALPSHLRLMTTTGSQS